MNTEKLKTKEEKTLSICESTEYRGELVFVFCFWRQGLTLNSWFSLFCLLSIEIIEVHQYAS